ncbi:MAG: ion channel [Pseudomonadota bacterium]
MDSQNSVLKSSYFYLLVALVSFFLINPFLEGNRISNIIIVCFFCYIILLSIYIVAKNRVIATATICLGALSFVSYWYIIWVSESDLASLVHFVITILFLGTITFSVISSVTKRQRVTADTLLGAICGYLLLGFTWSFIYLSIASVDPDSFSIHRNHDSLRSHVDHFVYYSFVTLTTTGYGDILALKSVARTFSWMEAAIGQIYLAVWISQLVGLRILQHQDLK